MMNKLTREENAVVEKYMKGEYNPFNATEEEMVAMNGVIDKAEHLQDELDALEEVMAEPDCDLIKWYVGKIKNE